jgi:hypothetical protein
MLLKMSAKVPHQEPPRKSQTVVLIAIRTIASRHFLRQYHARRRPMMSSSRSRWLSAPKRLGQGIRRRKRRSAKPRKTITTPSVASSDQYHDQPFCCVNQMKSAGLVSSATTVAARVSRRHWSASSVDGAWSRTIGVGPIVGSAVAMPD